jgi:hypothetical protein
LISANVRLKVAVPHPPVNVHPQVLPLGTGNDLSLTFGWGNTFLPAWLRRWQSLQPQLQHRAC